MRKRKGCRGPFFLQLRPPRDGRHTKFPVAPELAEAREPRIGASFRRTLLVAPGFKCSHLRTLCCTSFPCASPSLVPPFSLFNCTWSLRVPNLKVMSFQGLGESLALALLPCGNALVFTRTTPGGHEIELPFLNRGSRS